MMPRKNSQLGQPKVSTWLVGQELLRHLHTFEYLSLAIVVL